MDIEEALKIRLERSAAAEEAFQSVTRVVVIKNGAYTEHWADSFHVRVEDAGRTVKLVSVGVWCQRHCRQGCRPRRLARDPCWHGARVCTSCRRGRWTAKPF